MNYYNPDSILQEEEKLKVKFKYHVNTFGFYINPSFQVIKKETKVDLPYFLVSFLIANGHCYLLETSLDILKDDLNAHASLVDLKNKHFYFTNSHFCDTKHLLDIFYDRLGDFVKLIVKEDFSEDDVSKMSYDERKYIAESRRSYRKFQDFYFHRKNS